MIDGVRVCKPTVLCMWKESDRNNFIIENEDYIVEF